MVDVWLHILARGTSRAEDAVYGECQGLGGEGRGVGGQGQEGQGHVEEGTEEEGVGNGVC